MSPEIFEGEYDIKCDTWSLGVILYYMLIGFPPFYAESEKEIIQMILKKKINFESNVFIKSSSSKKFHLWPKI